MPVASKPLVWFITGSTSGFGAALSLIALKAGHKVIATSRNPLKDPDLKRQVEGLGGVCLSLDITSPQEKIQEVVEEGRKRFGRIDVLVNNAGVGVMGALEDLRSRRSKFSGD